MLSDRTNFVNSPAAGRPSKLGGCDSGLKPPRTTFVDVDQAKAAYVPDADDEELARLRSEHESVKIAERFDMMFGSVPDRSAYDASVLKRNAPEIKIFGYPLEYLKQETGRLSDGFKQIKAQRDSLLRELLDVHASHEMLFERVSSFIRKLHSEKLDLQKKMVELEKRMKVEMLQSEKAKMALGKESDQVMRLEAAIEQTRNAIREHEQVILATEEREKVLTERLEKTVASINAVTADISQTENQIRESRMATEQTQEHAEKHFQNELSRWNQRINELETRLGMVKEELQAANTALERDKAELESLSAENHLKHTQVEALRERAQIAQEKLNEKDSSVNLALQTLRETQDLNQARIEALLKEKARHEARLDEAQAERKQINERLHEALSALDRYRDKEDELAKRAIELEVQVMESTNQIHAAQIALDQARVEAATNTQLFNEAKAEMDKIAEQATAERTRATTADQQTEQVKTRMDKLSSELGMLRRTLDKLSGSPRKAARILEDSRESESLKRQLSEAEMYRQRVERTMEELAQIKKQLFDADTQRRALLNEIQTLKGNIQVMVRVRPRLGTLGGLALSEINRISCGVDGMGLNLELRSDHDGQLAKPESHPFSFNRVFDNDCNQQDVFRDISCFVQSALDGYSACILAYGPAKSGKTWTMLGDYLDISGKGIIPRSTELILDSVANMQAKGWTFVVECSYMEICNEVIRDLLAVDLKQEMSARHDLLNRNGTIVATHLRRVAVKDVEEVQLLLEHAEKTRAVLTAERAQGSAATQVFTVYISGKNPEKPEELLSGTLYLCDLADACSSDKGVNVLSEVFQGLAQKNPTATTQLKNSTFTHLISPCLMGEGKLLMLTTLSSDHDDVKEGLSVLRFAQQVNKTEIGGGAKTKKKEASGTAGSRPPARAGRTLS